MRRRVEKGSLKIKVLEKKRMLLKKLIEKKYFKKQRVVYNVRYYKDIKCDKGQKKKLFRNNNMKLCFFL